MVRKLSQIFVDESLSELQHSSIPETATLTDLNETIRSLSYRHSTIITGRKIESRLEPIIGFVEKYAKAVDVLSQGVPFAALIWGSLRILLELASSASRYFQKVMDVLERLGDHVGLYARYEDMFQTDSLFASELMLTHLEIMEVFKKARRVLERSGKLETI
ncbi:hypothetical protein NX059_011401 [Plenodomus lindquistii]|nr:hypothetical protein NX059_011401 [Plenodomus lindquistii]